MARTIVQDAEELAAKIQKGIEVFKERHGIHPAVTITPSGTVKVTASLQYEAVSKPGIEGTIETKGDTGTE